MAIPTLLYLYLYPGHVDKSSHNPIYSQHIQCLRLGHLVVRNNRSRVTHQNFLQILLLLAGRLMFALLS